MNNINKAYNLSDKNCNIKNNNIKPYQMKGLFIIILSVLIAFSVSGQPDRWKQKNARINFVVSPQFEFVKIAGSFSPAASLSGSIVFNSTYSVGGYLTKKVISNYNTFPILPGTDLDANFQHGGLEFIYFMKLGLYRTKGGHYVYPKLKVAFGSRLGAGMIWFDDIDKNRYTPTDYFGYIEPMVGVSYPLTDFITVHGGACFTTAVKIQKLDAYIENKDFTGPGVFLAFKFSLYR
jgi:hypothetical protein